MDQLPVPGTVKVLLGRASFFFHKRCLVGFPWFWPSKPFGNQAMVYARHIVRRNYAREHPPIYRGLARILVAAVWPFAVLVHMLEIRRVRARDVVPIKRLPGAFWSALRHNVLPGEYYAYALWKPDHRTNIDNYLYAKEGIRLFGLLNKSMQPNPINDKLAFYELCKTSTLPTPAVLAAFAPAGASLEFESGLPPDKDLFVKQRFGSGGNGAERLRWKDNVFESDRSTRVQPEDLRDYLKTRARNENCPLLVQLAQLNHPALGVEPNGALATARIVSGITLGGDVVPLFGYIYFGEPNAIVAHGRVALIDITSGRLTSAPQDFPRTRRAKLPTDFGSTCGCILPDWENLVGHIKAAHRACSNYVFIGWDVAFTPHGPMLLEGNANWCADVYQSLFGKPLGHTEFASILAERFRELDLI